MPEIVDKRSAIHRRGDTPHAMETNTSIGTCGLQTGPHLSTLEEGTVSLLFKNILRDHEKQIFCESSEFLI